MRAEDGRQRTEDRTLLSSAQVAQRLAHATHWFYRHKKRLIEREGFPPPVLANKWDPAAIDAWLDARMPAELRADIEITGPDYDKIATDRTAVLAAGEALKP